MKVDPSGMVWSGMLVTFGGSFIGVTVNVALSESVRFPVSVAVNVMVSAPFQSGSGIPMVAIRLVMVIVSDVFPVVVQVMLLSGSSTSVT